MKVVNPNHWRPMETEPGKRNVVFCLQEPMYFYTKAQGSKRGLIANSLEGQHNSFNFKEILFIFIDSIAILQYD